MDATLNRTRRTALIVAHPGHEVFVHGWMERTKPLVFVLTDGSGREGLPRIAATAQLVKMAQARRGSVFGRYTDESLERVLRLGEHDRLISVVQELADGLIAEQIDEVVGDAGEGCDPAHDACRMMIDAACTLAARRRPHLTNLAYSALLHRDGAEVRKLPLEGAAWSRKLAVMRCYPDPHEEIGRAVKSHGVEAMRVEILAPVLPWSFARRGPAWASGGWAPYLQPAAEAVRQFVASVVPAAA